MRHPSSPEPGSGSPELKFDPELAALHKRAAELRFFVSGLVSRHASPSLHDQLERASLGVMICITEGSRRPPGGERFRFLDMARGNIARCSAVLQALRVRGLAEPRRLALSHSLAARLMPMVARVRDAQLEIEERKGARKKEHRQSNGSERRSRAAKHALH